MITIGTCTIKEVLDEVGKKKSINKIGHNINLDSQRLKLFKRDGVKCVCCEEEATHMSIDFGSKKDKVPHFNLRGKNNLLFTKDHIIPYSKGGKNYMTNYQVMCEKCNLKKQNREITLEELKKEIKKN